MRAEDYPDEYKAIFKRALGQEVTLVFTTPQKAATFRVELYRYRYAVRDALITRDPAIRKHFNDLMKVTLSISGRELKLTSKKAKFVEKING